MEKNAEESSEHIIWLFTFKLIRFLVLFNMCVVAELLLKCKQLFSNFRVDSKVLKRNIKVIGEGIARHIFNLTGKV